MNIYEMNNLLFAVDDGNNGQVYYWPNLLAVKSISVGEDSGEAILANDTIIYLENVPLRDFKLVRSVSDVFD